MTAENMVSSKFQKYTLPLKAKSERKRLIEAEEALGTLYPFEINGKNILITGKVRKGIYEVYVSQKEIKKPANSIKFVLFAMILLLSLSAVFLLAWHKMQENKRNILVQKENEKTEAENIRIQKEKEEKLNALQKEYESLFALRYEKIYPRMERIYSIMTKGSTIENIFIERNSFIIEVSTLDAMKILKNLEENSAFEFIKMTKTSVLSEKETVTYSGIFSNFQRPKTEFSSDDAKLEFYEKEVKAMTERQKVLKNTPLSEYIGNIRNELHKHNCHEQYIQLHGNRNSVEVEFYILSSSKNILNFLSELQSVENCLVDIKQIRIRNSEQQDRIQTTIFFDSGIDLKQEAKDFSELTEKKIPVGEINQFFYKKPTAKNIVRTKQKPIMQQKVNPQEKTKLKSLAYIGLTKTNDKTFVLAKDEIMNVIYKLPMSETETSGDYCAVVSNGFQAKIRGEYYEVKK